MSRDFSGVDQYLDWGNVSIFNGLTAITFAVWLNSDDWSAATISIVRKDGTITPMQMYKPPVVEKSLIFNLWDNVGTLNSFAGPLVPATGTWHLVLFRWATGSNSGTPEYSLNGGDWTSCVFGGDGGPQTTAIYASGSTVFRLGATESSTEDYNGRLAEIAFWNRRLDTEKNILYIASEYGRSPLFVPSGLFFYSRLTGINSPENDEIGSLSGEITGATQATHPNIIYPKVGSLLAMFQ